MISYSAHHKYLFQLQYFKDNPDSNNPAYNTKKGIYDEGCGLDNVMMSWGHDEYMYLVSLYKHVNIDLDVIKKLRQK